MAPWAVLQWADTARDDVRVILGATLDAVNPQTLLRGIRRDGDDLSLPGGARIRVGGRKVRLIAVGKAAGGMAAHAQPWGPFEDALVVATHEVDIPEFRAFVGDHPIPTARSVAAGEAVLHVARACGPDDLLLVLLSGGASAMMEVPRVPLHDLAETTRLLLMSDTPISEVNVVRRHLSELKGGGLARACAGEVAVLAISDVPGGDVAALGSGPAAGDASTFADAWSVLERRGILDAVPESVRKLLDAGRRGALPETVKPDDALLSRVQMHVLADNETALRAGARAAVTCGYEVRVLFEFLHGEARDRGAELGTLAREAAMTAGAPLCILVGGETVVRVDGKGKGGRDQEVALAAVDPLSAHDAVLAVVGTDGVDGPTDAAGAIVDGHTRARADAAGLDVSTHLAENDAYHFFAPLGDLIRTGPTGTNVRDVGVLLVRRDVQSPDE